MLCISALAFLAYGKKTSFLGNAILSVMSLPCAIILSLVIKNPATSFMIFLLWFATFPLDAIFQL